MAVPKTTQTRYLDGSVHMQDYTSNPIPTSIFFHFCYPHKAVSSTLKTKLMKFYSKKKKIKGWGYLFSPLHTVTHISSLCGFWHSHPYILVHFLENVFHTCLCGYCCTTVPYRRCSFSKLNTNTFNMHA